MRKFSKLVKPKASVGRGFKGLSMPPVRPLETLAQTEQVESVGPQ